MNVFNLHTDTLINTHYTFSNIMTTFNNHSLDCSICYEKLWNPLTFSCGHSCCFMCYQRSIDKNSYEYLYMDYFPRIITCICGCLTQLTLSSPPNINHELQSNIESMGIQPTEDQIIPYGLVEQTRNRFISRTLTKFHINYCINILYLRKILPNIPSHFAAYNYLHEVEKWLCNDLNRPKGRTLKRALRFFLLFSPNTNTDLSKITNIDNCTKNEVMQWIQPNLPPSGIFLTTDYFSENLRHDPLLNLMLQHCFWSLILHNIRTRVAKFLPLRLFLILVILFCHCYFEKNLSQVPSNVFYYVVVFVFMYSIMNNIHILGCLWIFVFGYISEPLSILYSILYILFKSPNIINAQNVHNIAYRHCEYVLRNVISIVRILIIMILVPFVDEARFIRLMVRSQSVSNMRLDRYWYKLL